MSVEYMCPDHASNFIVPASTVVAGSGVDSYMVKFFTQERPVCTCPAYRYSGEYDEQTCKHIKRVMEHGCFYSGQPNGSYVDRNLELTGKNDLDNEGIKMFSTTKENVTLYLCPGCDKPMLEVYV